MNCRIILIDDDLINNNANERLMRKTGIKFDSVSFLDPTEALRHFSETNPVYDLMLLDINMPRISGWEFLERFQLLNINIPVIMLTSSIDPLDRRKASHFSLIKGYYNKPLSKEMIMEIFEKCNITAEFIDK